MDDEITQEEQTRRNKALWAAVLHQAVEDVRGRGYGIFYNHHKRLARYHAIEWFKSDRDGTGTFLWICDYLDLPAGKIRQKILDDKFFDQNKKNSQPTSLGTRILAYKKRLGLSYGEMAAEIGVSAQTIWRLVYGNEPDHKRHTPASDRIMQTVGA